MNLSGSCDSGVNMNQELTQTVAPSTADSGDPARERCASPPGFEQLEEIGRGGMGIVYRARDNALSRYVAIKVLKDLIPRNGQHVQRFLSEARITGQLQHPGVPPIYQVGELSDGRPYLAMKLIKGQMLASMLEDPA